MLVDLFLILLFGLVLVHHVVVLVELLEEEVVVLLARVLAGFDDFVEGEFLIACLAVVGLGLDLEEEGLFGVGGGFECAHVLGGAEGHDLSVFLGVVECVLEVGSHPVFEGLVE